MATEGKVVTCRAAVAWEPNKPFSIETVEVAVPKDGEVRIRMRSTGVCHSDLHFLKHIDSDYPFPAVLGHEGAGTVESVGKGVTNVKPGDTVVLVFESYCGECDTCKSPKTNMCMKQTRNHFQPDGTSRITCKGKALSQMSAISTFSEYTVVPHINVTKVNPKAPANRLCLAGCCIPTGYGAADKCAQVEPGSSCVIWGLGGVGMNVVMGCRDRKASKIIGVDFNPRKFPLAKELGCTDVINPKDLSKPLQEVLSEMTGGGPDYCFVSVGSIPAMEEAFNCSHPMWGELIVIGLSDIGAQMKVGVWELLYGRKVRGTFYGSYKAGLEIPKLVDKVVSGQIALDRLISHVLPLDQINHGFDMLTTGESIRSIIDFDLK